jgi:molybdenum cofactor synthesis domain-containing protein
MNALRVGILTVSDRSSRGERADSSGPVLKKQILLQGWNVVQMEIIPDEFQIIKNRLSTWTDDLNLDMILTTGGTGFSPRDITPEATQDVIQREAPGIAEAMRVASLRITPHAMLSRAVAGIRERTLIVNLPGSPKAAEENLAVILPVLPHAIQLLQEDPNSEAGHQLESGKILTNQE